MAGNSRKRKTKNKSGGRLDFGSVSLSLPYHNWYHFLSTAADDRRSQLVLYFAGVILCGKPCAGDLFLLQRDCSVLCAANPSGRKTGEGICIHRLFYLRRLPIFSSRFSSISTIRNPGVRTVCLSQRWFCGTSLVWHQLWWYSRCSNISRTRAWSMNLRASAPAITSWQQCRRFYSLCNRFYAPRFGIEIMKRPTGVRYLWGTYAKRRFFSQNLWKRNRYENIFSKHSKARSTHLLWCESNELIFFDKFW